MSFFYICSKSHGTLLCTRSWGYSLFILRNHYMKRYLPSLWAEEFPRIIRSGPPLPESLTTPPVAPTIVVRERLSL